MRPPHVSLGHSLGLGLGLLLAVEAIIVANDSPCGTLCGNVLDATTPSDITCSESSYMSGNGAVYQQCVSCELSSSYYTDDNETDTEWVLYNVRYAAAYCLFGVPSNDDVLNSPCLTSTACGPFKDSIVYKNLSSAVDEYAYCDSWPVNRTDEFSGCTSCLQAGSEYYLSNFITVLQAGCEQRPAPGITLSLSGSVFSDDIVNITSPTPTATVNPDWFDQGPITIGGKVGIAFGGFAVVLFVLGFFIVWNGKRRRRAFLRRLDDKRASAWPGHIDTASSPTLMSVTGGGGGGGSFGSRLDMRETPLSQRPLRAFDDSPVSARSEKPLPHHVSPFASQYSSPVSATELRLASWPVMASHPQYQPGQQLPTNPAGLSPYGPYTMTPAVQTTPSPANAANAGPGSEVSSLGSSAGEAAAGKGKERQESYEMQPVEGGAHAAALYQQAQLQALQQQQMQLQQQQQQMQLQQQQQVYYEEPGGLRPSPMQPAQFHHPGQMFPNMYQQHAQSGPIGFEEDAKK